MLITPAPRYASTTPSAMPAIRAPGPRPRRTKRMNWLIGGYARAGRPARGVPRRLCGPTGRASSADPLAAGGVLERAVALVRVVARAERHHRRQVGDVARGMQLRRQARGRPAVGLRRGGELLGGQAVGARVI